MFCSKVLIQLLSIYVDSLITSSLSIYVDFLPSFPPLGLSMTEVRLMRASDPGYITWCQVSSQPVDTCLLTCTTLWTLRLQSFSCVRQFTALS